MTFKILCCVCLLHTFISFSTAHQTDSVKIQNRLEWNKAASDKGCLYVYWGYNRDYYTRSDIHFAGPDYDFTLYNIKAVDKPAPFNFRTYFYPPTVSVPQYNWRGGYFFTPAFHLSFGIDHMKYVMVNNQQSVISGVISPTASETYAGSYLRNPITVSPDFLKFQHTNGLNLVSLEAEYLQPVLNIYRKKIWLKWNFGGGGIMVITRTVVDIFDEMHTNPFHLSGYTICAKTGPRIEFWKWGFIAFEAKGGYMYLPDILIHYGEPQRASQSFSFISYYGVAGFQIPIDDVRRMVKNRRK